MPGLPRFLTRLIPPTPMSRKLAGNSIVFASGEGTFLTISAVFLTMVVGLSPGQVGVALTLGGIAEFLVAYPSGRVVDVVGPKRMWALTALGQGIGFAALPFIDSFVGYICVAIWFAAMEGSGSAARNAYVLDVLPSTERVETQAYMYSSLNIGFTAGAGLGLLALAFDSTTLLRWVPIFTAGMMVLNAWRIARLPQAPHDLRVAAGEARVKHTGPGPMRNIGWMATSFFNGTMWTNQVLLHTVIPLWLVVSTDAPHWLLAWLFATNTVLCIFLPPYTAKFVRDLRTAMQMVWVSTAFFFVSCLITMATHSTVGLITVLLVWLGHVTVTGAELFISASSWSFQAELMDPRRRGEYQGVQDVFGALGSRWAPAAFTFLAMEWGNQGWLVIGGIIVLAAIGLGPSTRAAKRFADEHFPAGGALVPEPSAGAAGAEPLESPATAAGIAADPVAPDERRSR